MTININRIPAPNTLIVFEASARHLSFTKAAAELNMTQAAVSKQMIQLEERLRVPLFVRMHRGLVLTDQGKKLYAAVFRSLGQIASAVADIKSQGSALVTLSTSTAFATLWLLPRLADFERQHPGINLRFIANDRNQSVSPDTVDLSVHYGNDSWGGAASAMLFSVEVFPVCSPEFHGRKPWAQVDQLADVPLLELTTEHWQGMDWDLWFRQLGDAPQRQHIRYYFNDYVLLQKAAEMGRGVCLAWSGLADEAIAQGRLVEPLKQRVAVAQGWGYYLSAAATSLGRAEVDAVRTWLLEQASSSVVRRG